ncbi:MAG: hypothetical protein Q4C98_04880 [Capnocytophaga sp.]|nr:hypothetical protein [Capnocytophaga sp.]
MLKVAFPVGEFFHDHHEHHSAEQICSHVNGKECQHDAHYSDVHQHHHDCIFFQLHVFFVPSYFVYTLFKQEQHISFFIKEVHYVYSFKNIFTRGPPFITFA